MSIKNQPTEKELIEYLDVPEDIQKLINLCVSDLYNGPQYFDADDDEVGPFGKYVKCFDFRGGIDKISVWFYDSDASYELVYNIEYGEISRWFDVEKSLDNDFDCQDWYLIDVKGILFGRELKSYI